MIEEDIRWIQRFSNFERAFLLLQNLLKTERFKTEQHHLRNTEEYSYYLK